MAVSDFIFAVISVPVRLAETETSSLPVACEWHCWIQFCASFMYFVHAGFQFAVSTQSLVWIGLDRFVAVVFPMKVHYISC